MNAVARDIAPANAVARHKQAERFVDYAFAELDAAPLAAPGVCFHPECSAAFEPSRAWQVYCSTACERAGAAELRKWGHRLALAALAWRVGKYEQNDEPVKARTRAARRFITQVQSEWVEDRARRAKGAKHGI